MLKKKSQMVAATADTANDNIAYTDTAYTAPTDADLGNVELAGLTEHAEGLKAVLDEAGVSVDTKDAMYAVGGLGLRWVPSLSARSGRSTQTES